ncbi:MAG: metallophosphoesterase [Anaerolineales bacterium]|nr:metallophosphoesterase [Anaerolineales bacterium]
MTAVVLHLSDIHIKTQKDPILQRGGDIAATVFSSLPAASRVFVVVSGDVAFSGKTSEYALASDFLTTILEAIAKESSCPVSFVVAPGNHDCNFDRDAAARRVLVDSLEKQESPDVDESIIDVCTGIQQEFFDFREALEGQEDIEDDRLWRTSCFEVEGKVLRFDCLNISWVSKLKEEPGLLYFPVERYAGKATEKADVRFVAIHHPLNWFNQSVYRQFRTFVRKLANIVISGHEHHGNVGLNSDAETDTSAFVEGCVLQGEHDLTDSSFNLIVLDLALGQFATTRYNWDGSRYIASEEGSWSDYHDLPAKRTNPFAIAPEFQDTLEDPGAFFKHPGRTNVGLSDIYVYPDLRKVGNGEDRRRIFINSSRLLAPEVTADGVLIEGEEKAGCTSLLYQLYRQYHDRGFVPLLIKGKDLKRVSDTEIDLLIRHTVDMQYGKGRSSAFEQISSTQKILLLDDFDCSPMKAADARAGLLCTLRKRFGHLVVTVGDMFEMREMLDGDASRALIALEHYKLQPFGHVLRGQLIMRWLSLGAEGTLDEATLIARRDQAEKLMNAVMQKSIIPAIPLYLLTLLQSMDAGRSGDFKESALGYYYQYLLTEAFQNSGVKPEKLTEVFQYSAHLAWEFHQQGKRELSELELRGFNGHFSKRWHTVDFLPRLDVLVRARVLCKVGEDYAFRYPYIFYYLKGQFLSENLSDLTIRAYIGHCCKHLYVRDHANSVLFLAHHTNDEFVLNSIAEALHNLFRGRSPLRFKGDTGSVSKLIENAPKLVYSGELPAEHRTRRSEVEDELDDGHDGLVESEEGSDELSLIAQMTMLFKTTEILGQVLKNQYAKIQRSRKSDLLEDLFNGPLRAIRDFYDFFEKYPDALVAEIEAAIQRKGKVENEEERKSIARKVVAGIVQIVTFVFLMRAAQSASSDSLLEDVHDLVRRNGSPAFKLIELGILLDSPKAIPRQKLKQLHEEVEKDFIAGRVIQIMVLNRLYMFKTAEKDMQWLSEELKIDLGIQHAITYQEKGRRLTK